MNRGLGFALVIGGAAAFAGAGFGVYLWATKPMAHKKRRVEEASPSATASGGAGPVAPGARAFRSVEFLAKQPTGLDPIADPGKEWHYRIHTKDGSVEKIERVSPSAQVHATWAFRKESGSVVREHKNGRGIIVATMRWSDDGSIVEVRRDGVVAFDGAPKAKIVLDAEGRFQELRYVGPTGEPVVSSEGCHVLRVSRDAAGRRASRKCFTAEGVPVDANGAAHEERRAFDARGLLAKESFHDTKGAAQADEDGCFAKRFAHDAAGNRTEETCLDASDQPKEVRAGYATTRWTFDARGCDLTRERVSSSGALVDALGVAKLSWKRDDLCAYLKEESFAADGSRAALARRPSTQAVVRDRDGNVVERRCRNKKDEPADCRFGAYREGSLVRYTYDDRGREISQKAFDDQGGLTRSGRSYPHEERHEYGANGRESAIFFFDESGKPAPALGDAVERTLEYDPLGGLISEKHWGVGHVPVAPTIKCHELRFAYDASHRLKGISCHGTDGSPAVADLCRSGVCWPKGSTRLEIQRTAGVVDVFYGLKGEEIERVECGKKPCIR